MLILIGVEMAAAVGLLAGFVARYYLRSQWSSNPMGRVFMALLVLLVGGVGSLLVLLFGVTPPLWLYAAGFAALDVVCVELLRQLVRAQRNGDTVLPGGTK